MGELPTMPAELIDIVCEYVADEDDDRSLSALALASSTILHLVRSRRYFKIQFPRSTTCPVRAAANYSSFAELLTKSPPIGQHVREIIISFRYYDILDDRSWNCDYEHPNSPQCDGPTRRRSYNESMNALSSILPGIPHVRVLKLLARPDLVSWNLFPPDTQSALSSLILQDSVVSLLLSGISHLPVPLLVSILQLRNLTSLNWSHISHNPADLIPFQALRVSSLNNIRNLCLSGQAIFGAESLSELTNVASLVLRASVAKIEHFTCYNWYCHTTRVPVEVGNLTNLKRLSLGFHYIPFSCAVLPFIRSIAHGGHQSMEILEFRIHGVLSAHNIRVKAEDLAEFDHLLQEQAFSNLQEVQFFFLCQFEVARIHPSSYRSAYSIENIMSAITELLPRSISKGIKCVALAPAIPIYPGDGDVWSL